MGTYINIGNAGFASAWNGEYVDKSGLIAVTNNTLNSPRRFSCVTHSRTCTHLLAMMVFTISPSRVETMPRRFVRIQTTFCLSGLITTRSPRSMSA